MRRKERKKEKTTERTEGKKREGLRRGVEGRGGNRREGKEAAVW